MICQPAQQGFPNISRGGNMKQKVFSEGKSCISVFPPQNHILYETDCKQHHEESNHQSDAPHGLHG